MRALTNGEGKIRLHVIPAYEYHEPSVVRGNWIEEMSPLEASQLVRELNAAIGLAMYQASANGVHQLFAERAMP